MAEQGQGRVPPSHRAARLVILGALLAAFALPGAGGFTRGAWDQAGQVVAYFLGPLRGKAEPVPSPTPSATPARPKPKPKPKPTPTRSRAR